MKLQVKLKSHVRLNILRVTLERLVLICLIISNGTPAYVNATFVDTHIIAHTTSVFVYIGRMIDKNWSVHTNTQHSTHTCSSNGEKVDIHLGTTHIPLKCQSIYTCIMTKGKTYLN